MTYTKPIILLLFALYAGCAERTTSNANLAENKPVSAPYGVANSSSVPARAAPVTQSDMKRAGGGGGGGEDSRITPAVEKISLDQATNSQNVPVDLNRKIIRNADLNLETESPVTALQKITAIAESKGGFVVESQESSSDVKTTEHDVVTMTVRVPAGKFNEALDEIRKTASRVIVETVKGEDVTEEFIDIEARLKAEKALEVQFIEIMKRANSVAEALNVQRELADVRGEIEKIEGRKRFLENQSSLSTIKIRLQTPTVFSASSTGFFYRLAQAFTTGFDFALNFVLGLVTFVIAILPFAVVVGLPIFFIVRYLWKRQGKPRSFGDIAKEEIETE